MSIYLDVALFSLALAGCASAPAPQSAAANAPASQAATETKAILDAGLADNTATFHAADPDLQAVLDLVREKLKPSYETFDIALLSGVLGPDFRAVHWAPGADVLVESRDAYLKCAKRLGQERHP